MVVMMMMAMVVLVVALLMQLQLVARHIVCQLHEAGHLVGGCGQWVLL
jgi:hypothetical protein